MTVARTRAHYQLKTRARASLQRVVDMGGQGTDREAGGQEVHPPVAEPLANLAIKLAEVLALLAVIDVVAAEGHGGGERE